MKTLKRRLSFADVVSCIALFVALGGTAFAAVRLGPGEVKTVNIARQAVTSAKIKREAVTSGKIRNGSVNALDIGAGQVTEEKIDSGAVTGKKIGKKAVSPRTIAKAAVTEEKLADEAVSVDKLAKESIVASKLSAALYSQLVRNVSYDSATSVEDSEDVKSVSVECPDGKEAIGGGARLDGELKNVALTGSTPFAKGDARTGWSAFAHETGEGNTDKWSVTAFVICAEL